MADVLTPMLGSQFVHKPLATLRVPAHVLSELRDGTTPLSPAAAEAVASTATAALESGGGEASGDGALATIEVDHTTLRPATGDGTATSALTIELKPKAGVLPAAPPLATAHPGCCRFCLHVRSKQQQPSSYCPLDLFSAEPPRVRRALTALLRLGPGLNNVRVFGRDGSQVYGAGCGTHDALSHELQHELLQPADGAAAVDADAAAFDADAEASAAERDPGADAEALLVDVLVGVFKQEPLLQRLSVAHDLGQGGASRAAAAGARAQELLGGEAALAARIADWWSSSRPMPGSLELRGCVEELREWLIALTASDVSVMIALRRIPIGSDGVPPPRLPQPMKGLAPGVVRVRAGEVAVEYRLAVVDVQPKPISKARAHAELDERIAAMPRLRSSCVERARGVRPDSDYEALGRSFQGLFS